MKTNSGLDQMLSSPRGCVAFSTLDAVRSVVSFLSGLIGIHKKSPANLLFGAAGVDHLVGAYACNGNKVHTAQLGRVIVCYFGCGLVPSKK